MRRVDDETDLLAVLTAATIVLIALPALASAPDAGCDLQIKVRHVSRQGTKFHVRSVNCSDCHTGGGM
jgi:hypothetical protein